MTIALVDDQHLASVLREAPPPALSEQALFTTGCWYVRLCQAVLGRAEASGVLSRPFGRLRPAQRDRALAGLLELPDHVGLVSLRDLAPGMGRLRLRHGLNLLGMEVLAAALHLEAHVMLSTTSPRLEAALVAEGVRVELVPNA